MRHNKMMYMRLLILAGAFICQGCGLIIDAVQLIRPMAADELEAICARKTLHAGIAAEPLRPFVFPAIFTDEGLRITGLDVALVREISRVLSQRCGVPVNVVVHLVHFPSLFVELSEQKIDLFVSAVASNVPSPTRAGFAYSIPYFYGGGLAIITQRPEIVDRIRERVRTDPDHANHLAAQKAALYDFSIAVQDGSGSHRYAEAQLHMDRVVLCDSLPAAFESEDPSIDIILGKLPVLQHMVSRVRKNWQLVTFDGEKPFLLTSENYSVVMAEENYRLRWFVNDVLFELEQSGQLTKMRRRWLEDDYAYPRRAAAEGLSFAPGNMPQQHDQGTCRAATAR